MTLIIVLSAMTLVFTLFRSSQKYRLKKMEHKSREKSGESLTTSELREMIEDAVAGATEPMKDDLESLSMRLDQIEEGGERVLLEDEGGVDEGGVKEKTLGRQVRQRLRQR